MAIKFPTELSEMRMDKRALKLAIATLNLQMGFVKDPNVTAEQARELLLAGGILPEDNIGSCEILKMRSERE